MNTQEHSQIGPQAQKEDEYEENRAKIRRLAKKFSDGAYDKKIARELELACSDMVQGAIHDCIFHYLRGSYRWDENRCVALGLVNSFWDEQWPRVLRGLKKAKPANSSSYIYTAAFRFAVSGLRKSHPHVIISAAILGKPIDDDGKPVEEKQREDFSNRGQEDPMVLLWQKEKAAHFHYLREKMSEIIFGVKMKPKLRESLLMHILFLDSYRRIGNKKYSAAEAAARLSRTLYEKVTEAKFNLWLFRAKAEIKKLLLQIEDDKSPAYREKNTGLYTFTDKKGKEKTAKDKKLATAFKILYSEMIR